MVLVRGLNSGTDVGSIKDSLQSLLHGNWGKFTASLTIFGILLGDANSSSSQTGAIYQSILLITVSLVLIWALRQVFAGVKVGVRDAYYKGLYPLIPFLLVMVVIGLQLLPAVVANFLDSLVFNAGLASTGIEKFIWVVLIALLFLWTLYMITSSVFALYIVTLPDVRPFQALRSARSLVKFRRWTVMRKFLFLPFAVFFIGALIMLPIILFLTPLSQYIFLFLTMASLAVVHAYMYMLYRELLK
jgi:hypothetical protein